MTDTPNFQSVRGTATLAKGIALLNTVGESGRSMRFSEIVKATGIPKGTAHRLLTALVEHRLLRYDPDSQAYRLGLRVFELANMVSDDFDLRSAADPEIIRIRDLTRETIRLAILDGTEVVYIDQKGSKEEVSVRYAVGSRVPVYCSAAGKAILAFLDPEKQAAILGELRLDPLTPRTITDRTELKAQLDLTEVRGYALDNEEQISGGALGIGTGAGPAGPAHGRGFHHRTGQPAFHRYAACLWPRFDRGLPPHLGQRRRIGHAGEHRPPAHGAQPPGYRVRVRDPGLSGRGPLVVGQGKGAVLGGYPGPGGPPL